jgi:leader peptidase (prepilin peptidase)/N-methyltransferase
VLVAAYIFGLAAYQASGRSFYEPSDLYVARAIDVLVVVWCLWVGSSIGSFLNVVAWRMPRGESINGRSHCPRCQAQLKARDNFPVFGWLALGGRCRSCHLPIAARYPIVEAAVGLTIATISIGELYQLSIPGQDVHWHGGPLWAPVVNRGVLLTLLYHGVGLAVAWGVGLIRLDKHRLPARLVWFGFAATVVPMLAYPTLMVVPWQMRVPTDGWPDGRYLDALLRIITSVAAATILGRTLARGLCPAADPKLDPLGRSTRRLIDLIVILALPIILVGWQASPALTVLASLIAVGLKGWLPSTSDCLGRFAIAMPLALTMQIFLWRWLHVSSYWPSVGSSPWVILSWSAIALLIPLWLHDPAQDLTVQPLPNVGTEDAETEEAETGEGETEEGETESDRVAFGE